MIDPIIEEVRKHRDEHARKFDYDLNRICEDFRKHREDRLAKLKSCGADQHLCVAEEPEKYQTKSGK
jgi:hypothetical protein